MSVANRPIAVLLTIYTRTVAPQQSAASSIVGSIYQTMISDWSFLHSRISFLRSTSGNADGP
jgi:hypothetical protein